MSSTEHSHPTEYGRLNLEISNLVVRIYREYTGRGPTKSRAFVNGSIVVWVASDGLTKAERRLSERGEADTVRSLRH